MVVTVDVEKLKVEEAAHQAQPELDPPPRYGSGSSTLDADISESTPSTPQPINYISVVHKNQSVKGTYVVDPAMVIPQSRLSPLEHGENEGERKNIRLESHNGSVNVNIILDTKTTNQHATIHLWSKHGGIRARLNIASERPIIDLNAESTNGSVTLFLPRSFHGFLTLSTKHGSITFSDSVNSHVTTFSHVDMTKRCFIGDVAAALGSGSDGMNKNWRGDEIIATTQNGNVKIFYNDEEPKATSFFSRVFGSGR